MLIGSFCYVCSECFSPFWKKKSYFLQPGVDLGHITGEDIDILTPRQDKIADNLCLYSRDINSLGKLNISSPSFSGSFKDWYFYCTKVKYICIFGGIKKQKFYIYYLFREPQQDKKPCWICFCLLRVSVTLPGQAWLRSWD